LCLTSEPSDCHHELISAGKAISVSRLSMIREVVDSLQFCAMIPSVIDCRCHFAIDTLAEFYAPPPMLDAALAVISTVNIRC
jgi:hypothetical protein